MQRKGVLVKGTIVSALVIGDLGEMPVPDDVEPTPGFA